MSEFRIIVVGAGIAGLCASIGLRRLGHHVTVLESASSLLPIGIGIHLPPNALSALRYLGLTDRLEPDAFPPTSFNFRKGSDGSPLATFASSKPAGYWSMRRSHYQQHLYEAAVEAGVNVRLGARVDTIDTDSPSITLASGEILQADLIVVANGIKSHLRNTIIPEHEVSMVLNNMSAYRAYASREELVGNPETAPLFQEAATNVWLGYAHHAIVYPCGGDLYTVGATFPVGADGHDAMNWSSTASVADAVKEFHDFDPVLRKILAMGKDYKQWRLAEVPRLPRWTSKSGKVVLIGDSAHAMLQFLAQGAAMATEDAAALAVCIDKADSVGQIPKTLQAFERVRKWRCEIVQAQSRRNGEVIHMPDGEEQENRDLEMAGKRQNGLWNADTGPFLDGNFRRFLYEHDVVEHSKDVLESMGL
ncbi:salicylate hydroxylase [Elsinoe ampelina]|uniref:Salicylate hydroxylase n=1 Tax=Elsinoe ampelina TaxID=302913 RepID=A0A6A6GMQ6_9PEZI|nr:salicylate hydroxylase [Elsinoe ampelina]